MSRNPFVIQVNSYFLSRANQQLSLIVRRNPFVIQVNSYSYEAAENYDKTGKS